MQYGEFLRTGLLSTFLIIKSCIAHNRPISQRGKPIIIPEITKFVSHNITELKLNNQIYSLGLSHGQV